MTAERLERRRAAGKPGPAAASGPRWPADAVERRPVAALIPYARNARTHSDVQVAQIAASIREWGWTFPLLVDETGLIIAGHGRVLAAQRLGIAEVPVMVAAGWSEAQKRAYVIADNKLALNAGWDEELLSLEIGDLKGLDVDLGLTGFGEIELVKLQLGTDGDGDPDEAPEPKPHAQRRQALQKSCGRLCWPIRLGTPLAHIFTPALTSVQWGLGFK